MSAKAACGVVAVVRLFTLVLGSFFDSILPDYDTSTTVVGSGGCTSFAKWDGVYFTHYARTLRYDFLHFSAFFPGYPALMALLGKVLPQSVGSPECRLTIAAVLLSNGAAIAASAVLYFLTLRVLRSRGLAAVSTLLFGMGPTGVFLSAAYTESTFALLAFTGMYLWHRDEPRFACIAFFFATSVRSNGVLLAGFFAYDVLQLIGNVHVLATVPRFRRVVRCLQRLFYIAVVTVPLIHFQWFIWDRFCGGDWEGSWEGDRDLGCKGGSSRLYAHVQAHYWGNGLFRYWTLKQLPNFLIALPTVAVALTAIPAYPAPAGEAPRDWIPRLRGLLGLQDPPNSTDPAVSGLVFRYQLLAMVGVAVTTMHVQVINRFLVACPALYWAAAHIVLRGGSGRPYLLVGYALLWNFLGCLLFTNFYPWT